jgi:Flp pilus assembly protein TadD
VRRFYANALASAHALALACWITSAIGCSRPKPSQSASISAATRALVASAEAHERARRYDLARADYDRAVREAPEARSGAFAARKLSLALLFWGELADAETALEKVVSLRPRDASAWHDLGVVRVRTGDTAGGEVALRRAIALQPKQPMSRIAVAALLVNQRRFAEALREYDALLALDLPPRIRSAISRAQAMLRAELARRPPAR